MKESGRKQYDAFLKFNKGKRMVFVESEIEAGKFIEDFMLFHSGSSRLPAREKRLQREIIREFDLAGENDTGREDLPAEPKPGMLFYNTESVFQGKRERRCLWKISILCCASGNGKGTLLSITFVQG